MIKWFFFVATRSTFIVCMHLLTKTVMKKFDWIDDCDKKDYLYIHIIYDVDEEINRIVTNEVYAQYFDFIAK